MNQKSLLRFSRSSFSKSRRCRQEIIRTSTTTTATLSWPQQLLVNTPVLPINTSSILSKDRLCYSLRALSILSGNIGNDRFSNFLNSSNSVDPVEEAEGRLSYLLENSPDSVTRDNYLVVLRALASSNLPDAPLRAERWLHRLERHVGDVLSLAEDIPNEYLSEVSPLIPNSECYQRVIETWAKAHSEDSARVVTRAERWLKKQNNSLVESMRPDTACYNAFLDVCTRGRAYKNSRNKSLIYAHANLAESILRDMINARVEEGPDCRITPNVNSFNFVMRGWSRCRNNIEIADHTMRILTLLEEYGRTIDPSVIPNSYTYVTVMDTLAVRAKVKVERQCQSNRGPKKFKNLSWNVSSENGMDEIELLQNMLNFFHERKQTGNTTNTLIPTTTAYNTLLACWANISAVHENGPLEAEKILRRMHKLAEDGMVSVAPDSSSYSIVMRAWVNSNHPNRGQRVSWILDRQWKDYEFSGDSRIRPTVKSYNVAIRVWINLLQPQEAEMILHELFQRSNDDESGTLRPNSESFSMLIRAWLKVAQKGDKEALQTAFNLLKTMIDMEKSDSGVVSSPDLYSLLLGACRSCASENPEILNLAYETFAELQASHHMIESLHYSRLLQTGLLALSRVEDNQERTDFINKIIIGCKEAGLVSSPLLQALANGPVFADGWTIEESARLVEEHFPYWPLPPSYTRNLRQHGLLPEQNDLKRTTLSLSFHGKNPFV